MTGKQPDQPTEGEETFESLYRRLEEVTQRLEAGDLSLEESVALYEEGMQVAQRSQPLRGRAEQRIEQLREAYDGANGLL